MTTKTLSFFSRGTALVFDLEAHAAGVRRFVGRSYDSTVGAAGGWVPKTEPQVVPFRAEYVSACKAGDLWAADKETASDCGVPFDPSYGGEHPPAS